MRDGLGIYNRVACFGANSEIGLETLKQLTAAGTRNLILASRNLTQLDGAVGQLKAQGAQSVEAVSLDVLDRANLEAVVSGVFEQELDLAVVALGVLGGGGDEKLQQRDLARNVIETNFTATAELMLAVAQHMKLQGHGTIVLLSSVAAQRPRKANFVYGASKAGIDSFAQGLSDYLYGSGVEILIVRPGFVHTKMTEHLKAAPFSTTPERVAKDTVSALQKRHGGTIWSPGIMRLLMAVVGLIPRSIFKRLDL